MGLGVVPEGTGHLAEGLCGGLGLEPRGVRITCGRGGGQLIRSSMPEAGSGGGEVNIGEIRSFELGYFQFGILK